MSTNTPDATPQTHGREATLTMPSDTEVVLQRHFDAPVDLLWDVMTDPDHIRSWYGLRSLELTVCEVDLRVGGAWRYVQTTPDGQEVAFSGVYRELDAPHRAVYTEEYEAMPGTEYVVTATFEPHDGGTLLTTHLQYQAPEHRDGHLQSGMEWGANETYDRLDEVLAQMIA